MHISWIEYPDDTARRENRGGIERYGQVWADGPGIGTRWALPMDEVKPRAVLVHVKGKTRGIPHNYSVRGEGDG